MNTYIFNLKNLPQKIKKLVEGKPCSVDSIGKSNSTVIIFSDMVLKIEKYSKETERTIKIMKTLYREFHRRKIPVPKIISHQIENGRSYLLMSKISGKPACDEYYLEHPDELTSLLACGLKMLWNADISDLPESFFGQSIENRLAKAKHRVENNLINIKECNPNTFGENGFESPKTLLKWLEENKPDFEPVLSHGDFCLPNIFFENGQVSGFIDLGDFGIADKYQDIALCFRSLKHNCDGTFGGKVYKDFNPDILFERLGISPDWEKIKYYTLLDELF